MNKPVFPLAAIFIIATLGFVSVPGLLEMFVAYVTVFARNILR
jgi:hypothetical protein